jgi:hypothetical protein
MVASSGNLSAIYVVAACICGSILLVYLLVHKSFTSRAEVAISLAFAIDAALLLGFLEAALLRV